MEVFRRHTDYALRAALCLAGATNPGHLSVRQISKKTEIPYPITCKLMQKLSRAGLAEGILGLHGGYALTRPPREISVLDIIHAVQGPLRLNKCIKPKKPCSRQTDCPVHTLLVNVQNDMDNRLQKTSLGDLLNSFGRPDGIA